MQAFGGMDTTTGTKDTAIPWAMLLQSQIICIAVLEIQVWKAN